MEDDYDLKMLVYMILEKPKFLNAERMMALNAPVSACLLEQDFHERLKKVMFIRRQIIAFKWQNYFKNFYHQILSSHEQYLTCVMLACINEYKCHQIIFESFLSVCLLVKLLCDETLLNTGVNFCDINTEIFMVFYRTKLQHVFIRRGGFCRLIEYIRNHKYLAWKLNIDYSISSDNSNQIGLDKLEKELRREPFFESDPDEAARDWIGNSMAKEVISLKLVRLPALPSLYDLEENDLAYKKKSLTEFTVEKRTEAAEKLEAVCMDLHGCSRSNSSSKNLCVAKNQDNNEWHEKIIQAVIRHNHSKSSSDENTKLFQEEAVLQPLKDKIKSLIEAFDEYDKE